MYEGTVEIIILFVIFLVLIFLFVFGLKAERDTCKELCTNSGGQYELYNNNYYGEGQCICSYEDGVRNIY